MSHLENEPLYQASVLDVFQNRIACDEFVNRFLAQWKSDRDEQWNRVNTGHSIAVDESSLCEILDQMLTTCDVYSPIPEGVHAIDASQLRAEIFGLAKRRWRL